MRAGEVGETSVREASEDGPLDESGACVERDQGVPEFSAQQKSELVLASLRGQRTIAELCHEHEISETLLRCWREPSSPLAPSGYRARPSAPEADYLRRQLHRLERVLGRKTFEAEVAGNSCELGVSMRVAPSRELVAQLRPAAVVARVAGISHPGDLQARRTTP